MGKFDIIYQTAKDKGNPEELERNGPIYCNSSDAWLGNGYYFWHGHEELSHWWGKARIRGKYIVCRGYCNIQPNCFDLHDSPGHRAQMIKAFEIVTKINDEAKKRGADYDEEILLSKVIEWLKKKSFFNYEAINFSKLLKVNFLKLTCIFF